MGLLDFEDFKNLKKAGLSRYHNNLESFFKNVCTTYTTQDKINFINWAKKAGFEICSGGIMGLGENWEDRIDLAFMLKELNTNSVLVNILNTIKGTPFEKNKQLTPEEIVRICSIFRFFIPKAFIRLAGGRLLFKDNGRKCFLSGANAVIPGNMLATYGYTTKSDLALIEELNYKAEL